MHQFSKVEMFVVCTPEQSEVLHQQLLDLEVEMFTELGLHFKVGAACVRCVCAERVCVLVQGLGAQVWGARGVRAGRGRSKWTSLAAGCRHAPVAGDAGTCAARAAASLCAEWLASRCAPQPPQRLHPACGPAGAGHG